MRNLISKHVQMLAIIAFFALGFMPVTGLMAQNSQQNQAPQPAPSLIGTAFSAPNGYVYLGDKIYLCQNNKLTQAYEVVNIGKTIVIKNDGTYTKIGVKQNITRGTMFNAEGEKIN